MRPVVRPVWGLAVRTQLGALGRRTDVQLSKEWIPRVTLLVRSFERPKLLRRLLASLSRHCPGSRVLVVDDSERQPKIDPGLRLDLELVRLPFDSGVSAGRQAGLDRITTEFFVNLDDDTVAYGETSILEALRLLARESQLDLIGGRLVHLPWMRQVDYSREGEISLGERSVLKHGTEVEGFGDEVLTVCDKVENFFVARTDSVRKVGWDSRLKRLDHADFFVRAKGKLVSVDNPRLRVLHAPNPFDRHYAVFRWDVEADSRLLQQLWSGGG